MVQVASRIWLNGLMDDHHLIGYITKLRKKKKKKNNLHV